MHTNRAHTSPGCSNLGRSPLRDRQKDQRGWMMEREAEWRGMEGWGITITWMTAYRCLGLPDNLFAASTPSGSRWYQTTPPLLASSLKKLDRKLLAGRGDMANWSGGVGGAGGRGGGDKEWVSECSSSRTSLPLLLTFGWTFRWAPPSWLLLFKVRQRERAMEQGNIAKDVAKRRTLKRERWKDRMRSVRDYKL